MVSGHLPEKNVARFSFGTWLAGAIAFGVIAAVVLCCAGFCWLLFSFSPQRLSRGYFPDTFHSSLEKALPASLPDSIEFLGAELFHGAGDVSVVIYAKVLSEDIEQVRQQFLSSPNVRPLYDFANVLGREPDESEIHFTGESRWGECVILSSKEHGAYEVIFHTSNKRKDQGDSSNELYRSFKRW